MLLWWRCVGVERYGKLDLWCGMFCCFVVLCKRVCSVVVIVLWFCWDLWWFSGGVVVVLWWCCGGGAVDVWCCCGGVVAVLGSMERLILLCTVFCSFVVVVL